MKQLIVLTAVLPLMLVFMVQYTMDQRNSGIVGHFQDCVYTAKEQAKQSGYFTREIKDMLRKNISRRTGIKEKEVIIETDEVPKYRINSFDHSASGDRELIHYKISIPVGPLMAGSRLFGVKKEENQTVYTIESDTASELLRLDSE